jgi:uncharacterized alpha-E superfamily protein
MLQAFQPGFDWIQGDPRTLEALLDKSLEDEHAAGSPAYNKASLRRAARAVRDLLPDDCWLAVHSLLRTRSEGREEESPAGAAATLQHLDSSILLLSGLADLESETLALGPMRRFILMGRRLERALCATRLLAAALGGNLKPSGVLLRSLLAIHDAGLIYRQRYQREIQAGAAADLILADELNPRSIAYQLERFVEELSQFHGADSPMIAACKKNALKALTAVRVFETGERGGIASAGGNEAFEHLLISLTAWLGQISENLAREFFQPIPAPQSLREWT